MQKPLLNTLELTHFPIMQQLELEEALLRADPENWFLVNFGSPPAIVMGISGNPDEFIDYEKHQCRPIPVIRRFSGGGTVVVDEETLFVSLICNKKDVLIPSFPESILKWNGNLYSAFLEERGFSVREQDYAIGNRKCGGNAQYMMKERWLHHSTLLWDYEPERMKLLKLPKKAPRYREERNHEDFLCPLKGLLDSKKSFLKNLTASLEAHFILKPASLEEASGRLERPHRKTIKKLL